MSYECRVEKDSISPDGKRLTTMVVTYPRFVHCEMMTHRQFSRNAASSRAIPVQKMIDRVRDDPVVPIYWGKNQRGMQADEELTGEARLAAGRAWDIARMEAIEEAQNLVAFGVHKQIVNRLLEPFSWITVIISATEWSNFFALRCHPDAQPELQKIAYMMQVEYVQSGPVHLTANQWHLPFISSSDWDFIDATKSYPQMEVAKQISVARCARVSYLTHDGKRDVDEDLRLFDRLKTSGHWSPFEHVATPRGWMDETNSNFRGWRQYRKEFPNECL